MATELNTPTPLDSMKRAFSDTINVSQGAGTDIASALKTGDVSGALGHAARSVPTLALGLASDLNRSARNITDPLANVVATTLTGSSTNTPAPTAPVPAVQSVAPTAAPAAKAPQASPVYSSPGTADAPLAQPNLSGYVDKDGRRTFTPGTNAVPEPAAPGSLLTGAAQVPQVDGFGNSTTQTQAYQRQLDALHADKAAGFANTANQAAADAVTAPVPGTDYASRRNAEADRFTRFVNESDTARLAHDLGTGGGNAQSNAGKIAALQSMQQRDAAARGDELGRTGQINAATTARNQNAVTSKGQQLTYDAMTKGQRLAHDTALSQIMGSPLHQQGQMLDAALKQGTLDAGKVLQTLQQQLLAAKTPDEQAKAALLIRQIQGKDMPEGKMLSFGGGQVSDGNGGHINNPSGVAYLAPGSTEPKILNPGTPQTVPVSVGAAVQAPDGVHTFQGKTLTVKGGKVIEVK